MLGEHYISEWVDKNTQVLISLIFIIFCISGSIFYSIFTAKQKLAKAHKKEVS